MSAIRGSGKDKIRLQLADAPLFGFNVAVCTAVGDSGKETSVNLMCSGSGGTSHAITAVNNITTCTTCGNTDATTFSRGRWRDGVAVIVDGDELVAARTASPAERNMLSFSVYSAVDVDKHALPAAKPYFLELDDKSQVESYAAMVKLIEETPDTAYLCVFALKGAPKMYRLGVYENALTITPLAWPADIRQAPNNPGDVSDAIVEQAKMLVGMTQKAFDPSDYVNERLGRVSALIDAATPAPTGVDLQGKAPKPAAAPASSIKDALAASLAALQPATPAKKAPAKRAPAKRVTVKS